MLWVSFLWFQFISAFNFNYFDTENQYLMLNYAIESINASQTPSRYKTPKGTSQSLWCVREQMKVRLR